jgi:lysophospholipase L1-like esterase
MPASEKRLEQITDKLAELNPKAQIVYIGLYHPFPEFDPSREGAAWIGRWNNAAFQAANKHANVTVVPTYDIFQSHWPDLLYTDHFHPNGAGYDEMAARVMQVLK